MDGVSTVLEAAADLRTDGVERDSIAERLESFADIDHHLSGILADAALQAVTANEASDDQLVARAFRE